MRAPEGHEHLGQHFWDRVEEREGCWIYLSDSCSTPTYKGTSILVYVTGSREPKSRSCTHRKCIKPSHLIIGVTQRDEKGSLAGMPRQRRVRSNEQFSRWYSQC
jgi:hypothetical protein